MADLTLYTIADPEILAGALRGIAMVFDPTANQTWVSSGGLGLGAIAGVGLLITLLIILFKAIMTQKLELWTFLIMMVVYTMAFVPKTTLQVERIQDGQIEMVDGIPYGVALPAALMSGMMRAVTTNFELAFSDPRVGTYSETGFMDPLKTLMGMRNLLGTAGGNGHLKANFVAYAQKCMVDSATGEEVDFTEALRKAGSMDALFDPTKVKAGFVTLVQPTPSGYLHGQYSCTEEIGAQPSAAALLRQQVTTYISPIDSTKPIGLEADLRQAVGTKPGGMTAKEELERSITTLAGAAIVNQDVAIQDLVIGSLIRESGKYASIQDPTRLAETMEMTRAMEAWKVDSSASGSMFLATMQSSMDIMLFVWIALAPILAMTMIISGLAGLQMMAKFFLFGIWTQSWMPFAMVINYYMQLTISGKLESKLMPGGDLQSLFAVGYQDALYNEIGMSIATASQLLAYTPVLSLAILTGSYMALSNLGSAMSARDGYFDEKKMAADAGVASGGQSIASANQNVGFSGYQSQGIVTGAGAANLGYNAASMGTLSSQNAASYSQGVAEQANKEASVNAGAAWQRMFGMNQQHMQNFKHALQASMMEGNQLSDKKLNEYLKTFGVEDTTGLSADKKLELGTQLGFLARLAGSAKASGGSNGQGKNGSLISRALGLLGEAGLTLGINSSTTDSDAYKKALTTGIKNAWNSKDAQDKTHSLTATRGTSDAIENSGSVTQALNDTKQYGTAYNDNRSLAQRAQQEASATSSAGVNFQAPMAEMAKKAAAKNAMERPGSRGLVQGDQMQQLKAAAKADEWGDAGAAAMGRFQQLAKSGDWSGVADGIRSLMTAGSFGERSMGMAMAAEFIEMAGGPKDLADQYRRQSALQKEAGLKYDQRMAEGADTQRQVEDQQPKLAQAVEAGGDRVERLVANDKKVASGGTSQATFDANSRPMETTYKSGEQARMGAGAGAVNNTRGEQILLMGQRLNDSMSAAIQNTVLNFDSTKDAIPNMGLGIANGAYGTYQMNKADEAIQETTALMEAGQQVAAFADEARAAGGFNNLSPERQQQIAAALDQYTAAYQGSKGGLFRLDGGTSAGDYEGDQGKRLQGVAKHFRDNQGEYRQDLQDAMRLKDEGRHRQGAGDTQTQRGQDQWKVNFSASPGDSFAFEYGSPGGQRGTDGTPSSFNVEAVGSGEHLDHQTEPAPRPAFNVGNHFPKGE